MPYSFDLRQEAVQEFTESYLWYEEQQEGLGDSFKFEIQRKLKYVCNNPYHYKASYKKFYEAVADKFPFIIVYTIDNKLKLITVFAIFHTSRNPKKKFKRSK